MITNKHQREERRGGGRHRKAEYKWKELLRGEEGLMGRRDLGNFRSYKWLKKSYPGLKL